MMRPQRETQAAGDVLNALVPSMILQPIVENAIKHGAERITERALIVITAERVGGELVIRVKDNGPGVAGGQGERAGGVGLRNSRSRLAQLYGGGQRLTLASHPEGGAVAEIRVPFHVQPVRRPDGA